MARQTMWLVAGMMAWSALGAQGQSPAPLPRSPGAASPPAYAAPAPAPAERPVPAAPAPPPVVTLAPDLAAEPELAPEPAVDEEGLYWFWGERWPGLALGPKFGTTGVGADLIFGINRHVNLRGGLNYGTFTLDTSLDGVNYDFDVEMTSFPLMLDIYPFGGHFHISAGLYVQPGTKADIEATPTGPEQIGEHTYPPEVMGTLSGKIEVENTVAPYLGLGFGNTVHPDQLLTFMLDFGLVFESYDVSLTSNGAGMETPVDTFRRDLKLEEQNMQDDLDSFRIYPVLTIGLAWHF